MNIALPIEIRWKPSRRQLAQARRASIFAALFGLLVYGGVQSERNMLFFALTGHGHSQPYSKGMTLSPAQTEELRLLHPQAEFPRTRLATMTFSSRASDMCPRAVFDNRTGLSFDAGEIFCGSNPPDDQIGQERTLSLLRAFRK
jgi:hypothetical protein